MSNVDDLLYDNDLEIVKQSENEILYHIFHKIDTGEEQYKSEDKRTYLKFLKVVMCPIQWCYKTNMCITKSWNELIMMKLNELNKEV